MKLSSKQSTGSVIDSVRRRLRDPFTVARLRFTALFAAVTMLIVLHFSLALFYSLERGTWAAIDRGTVVGVDSEAQEAAQERADLFSEAIDAIEDGIVITDIAVLFVVAFVGYYVAGRVLAPIDENMRTQKRFLADVSHDLRTPLAIMKADAQVLLAGGTPDRDDCVDVVKSNLEEVEKMTVLVEDLLVIARTEGAPDESRYATSELGAFLAHLVEKNSTLASRRGVTLVSGDTQKGHARVDTAYFERAVQNIVSNAIKYTEDGGTVTVSGVIAGRDYLIRVADTGVGISAEDLPHVFDRFYKASHSRASGTGCGLGLAIAKQIVEQHGGKITMTSAVGKGTTVEIRIPKMNV